MAHMLNMELKLDITSYEEFYKLRSYGLGVFNIHENYATPDEIYKLTLRSKNIFKRISTRILRKKYSPPATYVKEKLFHFDPEILILSNNIYLDGRWQSEKYFSDIEEIIRREFSIETPQQGKDKEMANLIASCEAVSLHIRRGDYVTNPGISKMLGICELDYYYRCVDHILQVVKKPHFFIFSDSMKWVRENLKLPGSAIFIDHNGARKNYEDLRLMSQCKHHIIANSSFSWWGAWLGRNDKKIIIAPKKWFNDPGFETKDLIPRSWMKM